MRVRDPGNISHSRWLTVANRILRLYASTQNPSSQLIKLVKFVMLVYVPTWFDVKLHGSIITGSKLFFNCLRRVRDLDLEIKSIVEPVAQRNGFFAHHENVLLNICSDDKIMRQVAARRIKKCRMESQETPRTFEPPKINFAAESYTDMVSWLGKYTEPPPLQNHSLESIDKICETGVYPIWWKKVPCHNQAVERHIKLVSEASTKVCGQENREGFIKTTLFSRKLIPTFESKKEFRI